MELDGKIAIVTGPAKGMGEAISMALTREGADLVLTGRDMAPIEAVLMIEPPPRLRSNGTPWTAAR